MSDDIDSNEILEQKFPIITIEDEMRDSYLEYAMSVIVGRALPDVRDGLKPVHRRVLYAMDVLGNDYNKSYKKSARIVGDVIGKYHPHGDTAVYDTIVRMAQPFAMRNILVDGQGNFGSVDGDRAAAMRYTEIRMTKLSHELLRDLDKETVDFIDNYDGSESEPSVLPTRVPNLLINGSSGIAVGMATNIPTHNLTEVAEACLRVGVGSVKIICTKETIKTLSLKFPSVLKVEINNISYLKSFLKKERKTTSVALHFSTSDINSKSETISSLNVSTTIAPRSLSLRCSVANWVCSSLPTNKTLGGPNRRVRSFLESSLLPVAANAISIQTAGRLALGIGYLPVGKVKAPIISSPISVIAATCENHIFWPNRTCFS